jgi:hypothetical protein
MTAKVMNTRISEDSILSHYRIVAKDAWPGRDVAKSPDGDCRGV